MLFVFLHIFLLPTYVWESFWILACLTRRLYISYIYNHLHWDKKDKPKTRTPDANASKSGTA